MHVKTWKEQGKGSSFILVTRVMFSLSMKRATKRNRKPSLSFPAKCHGKRTSRRERKCPSSAVTDRDVFLKQPILHLFFLYVLSLRKTAPGYFVSLLVSRERKAEDKGMQIKEEFLQGILFTLVFISGTSLCCLSITIETNWLETVSAWFACETDSVGVSSFMTSQSMSVEQIARLINVSFSFHAQLLPSFWVERMKSVDLRFSCHSFFSQSFVTPGSLAILCPNCRVKRHVVTFTSREFTE